jgi:DNA-binding GntR family transcriptional regulator
MDLKISPQTVQLETARKLREAIMTGHFKPGERMVETSLCERLGVSRTSLRETLRMLAAEKLIVMTPNRGPSVAIISREEAEQIYHVRAILEGEMAALAAKRVKDADVAEMHAALKHFEEAVAASDTLTRLSATTDFYEVIIRSSGNHIIGDLIHGLHARINFLRARTMASPGRPRHSVREMTTLYEAIARRDVRAARGAAVAHVLAARDEAQHVYEQTLSAA